MDKQVLNIDTVCAYNEMLGIETLHPLVSVIEMSRVPLLRHSRQVFGFYAIFLKEVKCGDLIYGRQYYDYQEGTLVCLAPGQVIGVEDDGRTYQPKGWALVFHPDLIRGTSLGRSMKDYSFFSYEVSEALHLSEREREMVIDCLRKIRHELEHPVDRHSRRLIAVGIEMLLDYCDKLVAPAYRDGFRMLFDYDYVRDRICREGAIRYAYVRNDGERFLITIFPDTHSVDEVMWVFAKEDTSSEE